MKNILKKSLLLCCLYYTVAIVSCNYCKCSPSPDREYKYKELLITSMQYSFEGDSTYTVSQSSKDTLANNEYGISIQINYELISQALPTKNFDFVNSAYACDCVLGNSFSNDSLNNLRILTLNDFDNEHPAGTDITANFKILNQNYSPKYISYEPIDKFAGNYLYAIDYNGQTTLSLYLSNTNKVSKSVAFEVIIDGANGTQYKAKTKSTFLK